jgi:hypothetical protein
MRPYTPCFLGITMFSLLCAIVAFPEPGEQAQQTPTALANRLLLAMNIDEQMGKQYAMMREMQMSRMQQMMGKMGNDPEVTACLKSIHEEIHDLLAKELSWESSKDELVAIYASIFSTQELRGLVEFYEGPIGQVYVLKTPDLMAKTMEVAQKRVAALTPRLQESTRKYASMCKPTPAPTLE